MTGMIKAIASDLDGTLTVGGHIHSPAIAALEEARKRGLATVLVTGRTLPELQEHFAGLRERFDAVVAENGAVLALQDEVNELGPSLVPDLAPALADKGVDYEKGQVLIGCAGDDATIVGELVDRLGLDAQVVHNRGRLMVLPAGISKGTGLAAAVRELGLSPHNVLAFGDAQNDLSLLAVAEVGVAVGDALHSVRLRADVVLDEPEAHGIARFVRERVLGTGRPLLIPRRRVTIGTFEDGTAATIPAAQANVLITGGSGRGKSHLAGMLVELWVRAGYTVLVVDIAGDYVGLGSLRNVVVLGGREPPSTFELLTLLRQESLSIVLDLSGVTGEALTRYLAQLPKVVQGERAARGVPHWIVLEEAQQYLAPWSSADKIFRGGDRGYCLITYRPQDLRLDIGSTMDVRLAMIEETGSARGRSVMLSGDGLPPKVCVLSERRTRHVRHWHKYTSHPFPPERWFTFNTPEGQPVASAINVADFVHDLRVLEPSVIAYHLSRGDFSRWLHDSLGHSGLAAQAASVERDVLASQALAVESARDCLVAVIEDFYRLQAQAGEPSNDPA